jgi:hypothetical protein
MLRAGHLLNLLLATSCAGRPVAPGLGPEPFCTRNVAAEMTITAISSEDTQALIPSTLYLKVLEDGQGGSG